MSDGGASRRLPVFFCPYCGEEDIRPYGDAPAQWRCGDCRRVWTVRFVGLAATGPGGAEPGNTRPNGAEPGGITAGGAAAGGMVAGNAGAGR